MTRLFAMLAIVLALSGCGASALQTNATIASASAVALNDAGDTIEHTRHAEEESARITADTQAAAVAAVDAVRHRWAAVVAAHDVAAAAQRAYADAIVAVAAGKADASTLAGYLPSLAAAWRSIVAALAPLGVQLPALPGGIL